MFSIGPWHFSIVRLLYYEFWFSSWHFLFSFWCKMSCCMLVKCAVKLGFFWRIKKKSWLWCVNTNGQQSNCLMCLQLSLQCIENNIDWIVHAFIFAQMKNFGALRIAKFHCVYIWCDLSDSWPGIVSHLLLLFW